MGCLMVREDCSLLVGAAAVLVVSALSACATGSNDGSFQPPNDPTLDAGRDDERDRNPLPDARLPTPGLDAATEPGADGGTCNATTCPSGCCAAGKCVPGASDGACGTGGKTCSDCRPPAATCKAQACVAAVCDATSCPHGCCSSGVCVGGTTDKACGATGAACLDCTTQSRTCGAGGTCAPPACGPSNCPNGCCDTRGRCQGGTSDYTCGYGGGACVDCTLHHDICSITGRCY